MKSFKKLFWSSIGIMVLTLIHHVYGALIYEEPFRLHVAYFAVPVILVLWATARVWQVRPESLHGKVSLGIFMILTAVVAAGMFGLYEGGYNHLLKNTLFFGGAPQETLTRLFPPPKYEMPNDFLFESTGTLQFFAGVYTVYCGVRFWRTKPAARPD